MKFKGGVTACTCTRTEIRKRRRYTSNEWAIIFFHFHVCNDFVCNKIRE